MEHEDVVKLAEEKYPINPEWNDHSKSISANRKAGFIDGYQEALKSKPLDDGIKYLIEDKNTEEWYGIDLSEGMKPLPNKSSFFTKDANEALHFNTSKEAQDHLDKFLKWDWCHVTEHKFVDDGQEGKGLRWVKASERLPADYEIKGGIKSCNGPYFCKCEDDVVDVCDFKSSWGEFRHITVGCDCSSYKEEKADVIYWLDESAALPVADK